MLVRFVDNSGIVILFKLSLHNCLVVNYRGLLTLIVTGNMYGIIYQFKFFLILWWLFNIHWCIKLYVMHIQDENKFNDKQQLHVCIKINERMGHIRGGGGRLLIATGILVGTTKIAVFTLTVRTSIFGLYKKMVFNV